MQQIAEEPSGLSESNDAGATPNTTGFRPSGADLQLSNEPLPSQAGFEPGNTGLTGFETGGRYNTGGDYLGGYVPPPTYQSAVDGSDGGVSGGRGQQSEPPAGTAADKGGYWLRQRH